MSFLSTLSDSDVERLLSGRAPAARHTRLEEVSVFVNALGAAVPQPTADPDPSLITRLADAAGASARTTGAMPPRGQTRGRGRSRAGLVARVGIAAAMVPVLFAGLAVAGVTLPGPARDAFDRVGLELPNQESLDSAATDDGTGAESDQDQGATGSDRSGDDQKDSNGKGEANRRSKREPPGPSSSARPNPPGKAVRRGPNLSPGTPRGKPQTSPSAGGNGGGNAYGQSKGNGKGSE